MDKLKELWETVVAFIQQGNNLYYIIGAAVALILIIVLSVVIAKTNKKRKENRQAIKDSAIQKIAEDNASLSALDSAGDAIVFTPPYVEQSVANDAAVAVSDAKEEQKTKSEVKAESKSKTIVNREAVVAAAAEVKKDETKNTKIAKVVELQRVPQKPKPKKTVSETKSAEAKTPVLKPAIDVKREENEITVPVETASKRAGFVQIYKDAGGKFRFRFKASNMSTVAHSQGYTTKAAAKNGIKAVQNIIDSAEVADTTKEDYIVTIGRPAFEVYKDNEGKFRFRLRAANTSNILASQGYTSKENCFNGIKSVRHIATHHNVIDDTLVKKND